MADATDAARRSRAAETMLPGADRAAAKVRDADRRRTADGVERRRVRARLCRHGSTDGFVLRRRCERHRRRSPSGPAGASRLASHIRRSSPRSAPPLRRCCSSSTKTSCATAERRRQRDADQRSREFMPAKAIDLFRYNAGLGRQDRWARSFPTWPAPAFDYTCERAVRSRRDQSFRGTGPSAPSA